MPKTGLATASKIAKVLEDAGVIANINDVTRIVIDLRGGHVPVIHLELVGDDRLIDIAKLLTDDVLVHRCGQPGQVHCALD